MNKATHYKIHILWRHKGAYFTHILWKKWISPRITVNNEEGD